MAANGTFGDAHAAVSGLFEFADVYEIAFGYRDFPGEVDLLLEWFSVHHGGVPRNVLEIAAGPADHALEFARRGVAATALDRSPAMGERATTKARAAGLELEVVRADMAAFRLTRRFDLAVLLLDSASLLLTAEAMSAFLDCVSRHLTAGGILVVDLSVHDRDGDRPDWTVRRGDTAVRTQWGTPADEYDPVTGIEQVRVRFSVGDTRIDDIVPAHAWTGDQLRGLAPGNLELVGRYSSMEAGGRAVRDIPLFRKR